MSHSESAARQGNGIPCGSRQIHSYAILVGESVGRSLLAHESGHIIYIRPHSYRGEGVIISIEIVGRRHTVVHIFICTYAVDIALSELLQVL